MLFGYPIEATSENWLHECLEQILRFIHNNLTDSSISTDWAEAISEPYKSLLKPRLKITNTTKQKKGVKEEESKREKPERKEEREIEQSEGANKGAVIT